MEPLLSCLPCIVKQAIYGTRAVSDDTWLQRKVVTQVMHDLAESEFTVPPVNLVDRLNRQAVESLGVSDPFQEQKSALCAHLDAVLDRVRRLAATVDADPAAAALRMSAAATHMAGFTSLDAALDRVADLARGPVIAMDQERFLREARKTDRAVLIAAGLLELPFDLHLLAHLGMRHVTIAAVARPFLWYMTADNLRALAGVMPFKAEIAEIVPSAPEKSLLELVGTGALVIAKGFAHFQTFHGTEIPLAHILYGNRWCQPAMRALGRPEAPASGIVVSFNV
ncbi:MAG: ARMT1-like domain-containing protein [Planctomycetota bacterium]